jgi:threonine synthase
MHYISTRGQAPVRDFAGVLLAGLAEDGGLYVPESWPHFSPADWRAMRGLPYAELAARVIQPFAAGAIPFARAPGTRLVGGVGYSFDQPLRRRVRAYFSVVVRP